MEWEGPSFRRTIVLESLRDRFMWKGTDTPDRILLDRRRLRMDKFLQPMLRVRIRGTLQRTFLRLRTYPERSERRYTFQDMLLHRLRR